MFHHLALAATVMALAACTAPPQSVAVAGNKCDLTVEMRSASGQRVEECKLRSVEPDRGQAFEAQMRTQGILSRSEVEMSPPRRR